MANFSSVTENVFLSGLKKIDNETIEPLKFAFIDSGASFDENLNDASTIMSNSISLSNGNSFDCGTPTLSEVNEDISASLAPFQLRLTFESVVFRHILIFSSSDNVPYVMYDFGSDQSIQGPSDISITLTGNSFINVVWPE